jgi:hypothetical protein
METGKRTRISDNQRDILERFYGRGMVGDCLNYREMIESAVAETGLTTTQVKVNIPIIFFVLNSLKCLYHSWDLYGFGKSTKS